MSTIMMNKKDEIVMLNGLVNTLAIDVDIYLKNYVRMAEKTNQAIEYKEIDLDRSLELKQQTKVLAESMVHKKEQIKKLLDRLQEMIDEI